MREVLPPVILLALFVAATILRDGWRAWLATVACTILIIVGLGFGRSGLSGMGRSVLQLGLCAFVTLVFVTKVLVAVESTRTLVLPALAILAVLLPFAAVGWLAQRTGAAVADDDRDLPERPANDGGAP